MDRQQIIKVCAIAMFVCVLALVATRDLGYGLAAFVIAFLGWGGYEVLTRPRD